MPEILEDITHTTWLFKCQKNSKNVPNTVNKTEIANRVSTIALALKVSDRHASKPKYNGGLMLNTTPET